MWRASCGARDTFPLLRITTEHLAKVARAKLDGERDLLRRAVAQLDTVVDDDLGWKQALDG